jgi:hypothetical protein
MSAAKRDYKDTSNSIPVIFKTENKNKVKK